MNIEVDTITLPAYWASAIINGDYSGIDNEAEALRCRAKGAELAKGGWSIAAAGEPYFTWSYQVHDPGATCTGGDVIEYTMTRKMKHD